MSLMGTAAAAAKSPQSSSLNPAAREWFPPGYQPELLRAETGPDQAVTEPCSPDAAAPAVLPLSELPAEILSHVVGFLATQDAYSCILTSQQLKAAVRSGRMRFELKGRPRQLLSFPAQARQLDDLVQSLTRHMPAMSSCDLSMLPLEHRHVSKLSQGLHLLQHLDLSGCKKLQPSMTQQLLLGLASKQLRSLNLQRCFQLTDACLTDVLEYACGSHSSSKALQCIALSHLDLAAWPAAAAAAATAAADGRQSQDLDNSNNSNNSSSSSHTGAGSSDTEHVEDAAVGAGAATTSNDLAGVGAVGSTAVQWGALADRLLHKLPKQLCAPLPADGSASALRVLVLNNCSALSVGGLVALAGACPRLEYLFLGGSTLKLPVSGSSAQAAVYVPRSVAAAAAAGGPAGEAGSTGSGAELPAALQQLAELLQLPQTLPWEALSSCCDADSSSGCGQVACSCTCGCCSSAQQRGRAGSDAGGAEEHERARKRLHRNEPSAAAVATARGHALWLAYVAALLPGLKALEVTFMVPGLAGWLRVCLNRLHQVRQHTTTASPNNSGFCSSSSTLGSADGSQRPKVWQFSCATAVADALAMLSEARRAHIGAAGSSSACSGRTSSSGGGSSSVEGAVLLDPDCLSMAVRCAVNCSSRGRSTPLHMAADAGCACHVRGLVAAGAAVAARDASGASALFVACESGQAAAAAVLLGAGADALVGNTAGETPLYIAALRGHLSVVQLLLRHLSAVQVDWTQRQLYGDAWTPLMAAAVANRVNVALCLLRAAATPSSSSSSHAGSSSSSSRRAAAAGSSLMQAGSSANCPAVSRLLAAENRYGQTVLHIAARKGCRELLQLLLVYGAGQVAGRAVDAAGDTPLDIARRHGHEGVVRELLQQC